MVVHHMATLFIFLASHRNGFVRVGVAVVALHDVSDLPIDGIRIDIGDILRLKDSTAEDADEDEEQSESQVESLSAAESQLESEVSTDEMSMSTLF